MQLAWIKGYKDVTIESLIEDVVTTSPYHNLVKQIRNMKSREWSCRLQHRWREGNKCADWLAKEAIQLQLLGGLMEEPSDGLRELLGADIIGVTILRLVPC
ncbi:uncharacterized protein [Coffea arabica]|uniref:RNase H type-1 domain-containing protein n=1 Tax=Coffea arabica TaxID=13443 RepID=A0ABM4VX57_COFAR